MVFHGGAGHVGSMVGRLSLHFFPAPFFCKSNLPILPCPRGVPFPKQPWFRPALPFGSPGFSTPFPFPFQGFHSFPFHTFRFWVWVPPPTSWTFLFGHFLFPGFPRAFFLSPFPKQIHFPNLRAFPRAQQISFLWPQGPRGQLKVLWGPLGGFFWANPGLANTPKFNFTPLFGPPPISPNFVAIQGGFPFPQQGVVSSPRGPRPTFRAIQGPQVFSQGLCGLPNSTRAPRARPQTFNSFWARAKFSFSPKINPHFSRQRAPQFPPSLSIGGFPNFNFGVLFKTILLGPTKVPFQRGFSISFPHFLGPPHLGQANSSQFSTFFGGFISHPQIFSPKGCFGGGWFPKNTPFFFLQKPKGFFHTKGVYFLSFSKY